MVRDGHLTCAKSLFGQLKLTQVMDVTDSNLTCDVGPVIWGKKRARTQMTQLHILIPYCMFAFFFLMRCAEDLAGEPEAKLETDSSSRYGGRRVVWFQEAGWREG